MIQMLNKRRNRAEDSGEEGFTLIELMVVVLIIGILLAIAVPTFLNAQKNAKSKAATSNLRSALSAAKTVYADTNTYVVTASTLREAEPSLEWSTSASTGPEVISFTGTSSTELQMAVLSKNGDCFLLRDNVTTAAATAGTFYARDTDSASCVPTGTSPSGTGDNAYSKSAGTGWK